MSINTYYIIQSPVYFNSKNISETDQKILHVVRVAQGLKMSARSIKIVIGLNASDDERVKEDVWKAYSSQIRAKYKGEGLEIFSYRWTKLILQEDEDKENKKIDYVSIRNLLWTAQETQNVIHGAIAAAKKQATPACVKVIALDPDTVLTSEELAKAEAKWETSAPAPLITAGHYRLKAENSALIRKDGTLNWQGLIVEAGSEVDAVGKELIAKQNLVLYHPLPKKLNMRLVYAKPELLKELCENNLYYLNNEVIDDQGVRWRAAGHAQKTLIVRLYKDIKSLVENLIAKAPETPSAKKAFESAFSEFYSQIVDLEQQVHLRKFAVSLENILYPSERVLIIDLGYKKEGKPFVDFYETLKTVKIWGETSGAAEGEWLAKVIQGLWQKRSFGVDRKCVDFSLHYVSEAPERSLKLKDLENYPQAATDLEKEYVKKEGFKPELLHRLVEEASQKPESCLLAHFSKHRKFFLESERNRLPLASAKALIPRVDEYIMALQKQLKIDLRAKLNEALLRELFLHTLKKERRKKNLTVGRIDEKNWSVQDRVIINAYTHIHNLFIRPKVTRVILRFLS